MSTEVQLRRGTTAEHTSFTGKVGEVTVDTTAKRLVVHDGVTPGGNRAATKVEADAALSRSNHTGTQAASTISDFAEATDDRVAALLVAGANVTITYNDVANTLTVAASGGGGGADPTFQFMYYG